MFHSSELTKYRMRLSCIPAEMKCGFDAYDYRVEIWEEQKKILSKMQCQILLNRNHSSTEVQWSDTL